MSHHVTLRIASLLLGGVVVLPSCADEPEQSRGTYGSIDDLVSAVEDAGLECKSWAKPVRMRLSADSRYCDDEASIASVDIYSDTESKQQAIQESREFAQVWRDEGAPELVASLLVGENWIVEGRLEEVQALEPQIGGVVQDNTCAVADAGADGC